MPTFIYRGNPGYEFPSIGLGLLNPGDTVELTVKQADELGDEFERKAAPKKRGGKKADATDKTEPSSDGDDTPPAGDDTEGA